MASGLPQLTHAGQQLACRMCQPMYRANDAQKLAEAKHHVGLWVECFVWMVFDARITRNISLANVSQRVVIIQLTIGW